MPKSLFLLIHEPRAKTSIRVELSDAVARKEAAKLLVGRGRNPFSMKLRGFLTEGEDSFKIDDAGDALVMVKVFPENSLRFAKTIVSKLTASQGNVTLLVSGEISKLGALR